MSDQERGAYTPQPDAPLSFDARASRDRQPLPLVMILSVVVLLTLLAGTFLYLHGGKGSQNEPPRPVGEPIAAIKSAPPTDVGNVSESDPTAAAKGGPNFAAGPEQPMSRPAPGQTAQPNSLTVQPAPQTPMKVADTAPAPTSSPTPVPAPVAAKPQPAPVVSPPVQVAPQPALPHVAPPRPVPKPAPKPATVEAASAYTPDALPKPKAHAKPVVAKATPKPKAKPAAHDVAKASGVVVQIGAYTSAALAKEGWDKASALMGGMKGHSRHIEPVEAGGVTRYRSQVTGFASRAQALSFCNSMKAKGHSCIVKAAD